MTQRGQCHWKKSLILLKAALEMGGRVKASGSQFHWEGSHTNNKQFSDISQVSYDLTQFCRISWEIASDPTDEAFSSTRLTPLPTSDPSHKPRLLYDSDSPAAEQRFPGHLLKLRV